MQSVKARLRHLRPLSSGDRRFLDRAYRTLLGRAPDRSGRRLWGDRLRSGASRLDVVGELATSDEYVERMLGVADRDEAGRRRSDAEFLEALYTMLLGREVDAPGRASWLAALSSGTDRRSVVGSLAGSDEHLNRVGREFRSLTDLTSLRPERYRTITGDDGETERVFVARGADDFDWLEAAILDHGYYEQPGVWSFGADLDKQVMAEVMGWFEPSLALDLGCASGAVIECLLRLGYRAEGVEISELAIDKAAPSVRDSIHRGDLLDLELGQRFDLVFGLDIFEHLNPNRIDRYLDAIADLLLDGGFVFANIPVFGDDPGFGTTFPVRFPEWRRDQARGAHFAAVPVDDHGYPLLGHLIWADSPWWVRRFGAVGLQRQLSIERALHRRYDDFLRRTFPGRLGFYVFSKRVEPGAIEAVVRRIDEAPDSELLQPSGSVDAGNG